MICCVILVAFVVFVTASYHLSPDYRITHFKMHKVIVYDDSGRLSGMSRIDSIVVNKKSGTISMWIDGKYVDL